MTLRQLREELALTQDELGKAVGVDGVTIWSWENGRTSPLPQNIRKLAEVLKIPISEVRKAIAESKLQSQ